MAERRDRTPVDDETWMEFLGPDPAGCCGLCGNSGVVDTRGKVQSPTGVECGVRAFCICPNGRVMKASMKDVPSGGVSGCARCNKALPAARSTNHATMCVDCVLKTLRGM